MTWRKHLAGRRVVASVSGGKDSAALSLWLTEQGIDHDRVFLDTGWEHPWTYEYLRGDLTRAIGPIIELRGERPNPLYLAGATRVGCWPCIYARKAEIRLLAEIDPARVGEIATLERELSERAGAPRTWFQAPLGRVGCWPIEKIVEWSRTTHGGRQFELFAAPPGEAECVRWGLCDTGSEP